MISRRSVLGLGLAAAGTGLLSACTRDEQRHYVQPGGPQVAAAEAARLPGTVREFALAAAPVTVDLGGRTVDTWAYGGRIPGVAIRVNAGEQVKAVLANRLPAETNIHWHGVALRNDADGVPHVTQDPIAAGAQYTYQFTASHPGTYWFHPHAGVQLDRGLYAPLIVDDPAEPLRYDHEWIVVLDDWLDGTGSTPDDTLAGLKSGMMGGHMMGGPPASCSGVMPAMSSTRITCSTGACPPTRMC